MALNLESPTGRNPLVFRRRLWHACGTRTRLEAIGEIGVPQADIRDEHGQWLRYGRINLGAVRGCSECKPCLRNGYPLTRNDEAAPVGFSRRAQNPPPLGGGGSELFATSIRSRRYLLSLPFEAETTGFVQSSVASDESVRAGFSSPGRTRTSGRVANTRLRMRDSGYLAAAATMLRTFY